MRLLHFLLGGGGAAAAAAAGDEVVCSWCEGGSCKEGGIVEKAILKTSISESVGGRGFPYWRPQGQSLLGDGDDARAAVIVFHGALRNGDEYTTYVMNGATNALVFGAQVYEFSDEGLDASRELWWASNDDDGLDDDSGVGDWHWCGDSTSTLAAQISTCEILDEMVSALLDRARYPNLEVVVVAGHSAGGQIVQRYALWSKMDPDPRVRYVVANPSSVTYTSPLRPRPSTSCCDNASIASRTSWDFEVFRENCSYDVYGYGLAGELPAYCDTSRIASYAARRVVYLSGESDVCDRARADCELCTPEDGGLDTSCEAYAQGPCRMFRLHAFAAFVDRDPNNHTLVSVPYVGHNGCAMLQSSEFLAVLSGDCAPQAADYCRLKKSPTTRPAAPVVLAAGSAAWDWLVSRGGNLLVLRDSSSDERIAKLPTTTTTPGLSAVATLDLDRCSDDFVALLDTKVVALADAIFVATNESRGMLDELLSRDKTIGGIFFFSSSSGGTEPLEDPYAIVEPLPFAAGYADAIIDDGFVTKDRAGLLVAQLARLAKEGISRPRGLGVDAATAILIQTDDDYLAVIGDGTAYACELASLEGMVCERGTPLTLKNVKCQRLAASDTFDLGAWEGSGVDYAFDVLDGKIVRGDAYGPYLKAPGPCGHTTT
ncbi:hypothetical protein CTAYLR_004859 [Chrysophaeum taylorii]|uniref:Uncharacterized protein n=1 Tax=Chrysophaeum taylorii TaxID=2483200 RepID=A0AAD7UEW5_9STRA|nr:hypothetical protein CTAYLR_004859 [Chrysophaeum taylorii]